MIGNLIFIKPLINDISTDSINIVCCRCIYNSVTLNEHYKFRFRIDIIELNY